MKRRPLFVFFLIITLAVMAAIFFFSSQNASSSSHTSGRVVRIVLSIFVRGFDEMTVEEQDVLVSQYGHIVRKCAHFTEFAALGFSFTTLLSFGKMKNRNIVSLIFGILYAILDEMHQLFSDGRACSLRDVAIDTSGFLSGLIISTLILYVIERSRK